MPSLWVNLFAIEKKIKKIRLNYTNLVLHWTFKRKKKYLLKKINKKITKLFKTRRKKDVIAYNFVAKKKHIISSQFNVRYIFISYSIKYFIHTDKQHSHSHKHTHIKITPYHTLEHIPTKRKKTKEIKKKVTTITKRKLNSINSQTKPRIRINTTTTTKYNLSLSPKYISIKIIMTSMQNDTVGVNNCRNVWLWMQLT